MREEILFRGKRLDNGEWITGGSILTFNDAGTGKLCYMPKKEDRCVCTHDEKGNVVGFDIGTFYAIDPETVGQFTGHTDRNGKPIFEGDIIKYHGEPFKVVWRNTGFQARAKDGLYMAWVYISDDEKDAGEIVGNLFDNPEIMNE